MRNRIYIPIKAENKIHAYFWPLYINYSTSKEEKILRIGLAPKNKEKLSRHPERIYFTNSLEGAKRLIHNIKFIVNNDKFSIFEVDLKKLHMVRHIRWFPDPNYPGEGFYTYENIPPKYLKVVRRINKTK